MGSAHVTKYCPFETLQNVIIRKRASAEIILARDFNARTGEIDDAPPDNVMQNHPKLLELRMYDDTTINTYGKKLLELLKNNDLLMFNGRTCFDTNTRNSQFTCHKYNGASVVDYVIAGPHTFNKILDFSVGNKLPDSDLCPLTYLVNYDAKSVHKYPRRRAESDNFSAYRWHHHAVGKYFAKLESNMVQHAYETFLCDIIDTNNIDINQVVQNFYHLFENIICDDFKKRNRTSKCTFPKTAWFDGDCKELKSALRTAERQDYTSAETTLIRNRYKSADQRKKGHHEQALADEIDRMNTNNPADYLQFGRRYKGKSAQNNHIDLETFSQHYKESARPDTDDNFDYEYMIKIASFIQSCDSENESCYNEYVHENMNAPFTADELSHVLHKAKCNKACGIDGIPVEFCKYGTDILHNSILALLNYVFQSGKYPDVWSQRIVNPVYKTGEMRYPDNYRKITLLSSLGKSFDSILNNRLCFCKEAFKIDNPWQYGFKQGSRTTDNLYEKE